MLYAQTENEGVLQYMKLGIVAQQPFFITPYKSMKPR